MTKNKILQLEPQTPVGATLSERKELVGKRIDANGGVGGYKHHEQAKTEPSRSTEALDRINEFGRTARHGKVTNVQRGEGPISELIDKADTTVEANITAMDKADKRRRKVGATAVAGLAILSAGYGIGRVAPEGPEPRHPGNMEQFEMVNEANVPAKPNNPANRLTNFEQPSSEPLPENRQP